MRARPGALVLLVSPDRLTREVIGGWLGFSGYRVHAVANTAEALTVKPGDPVGLAILDLEYSCGTAVGVLDKIRRSLPDVPMIALTGCSEDADAVGRAVRHGAVAALRKHGSLLSLRQAVEDCLIQH
jgi:CheY-like chemotaxis protein